MQTVKRCRICGKKFLSRAYNHITCSPACRKEYNKLLKESKAPPKEKSKIETIKDCKHKDCIYYSRRVGLICCDYCYVTGVPRGCKISKCDKYISGKLEKEQLVRAQRETNIF